VPYTSNPTWTTSDQRFKQNVKAVENPLEKILALNGVYYDYKTGEEYKDRHFMKSRQLGFIAQEVEKIVPEVVTTTADGYKALAYQNLTALLVEGIKEQQKAIEGKASSAELQEKDEQIQQLTDRVTRLEEMLSAVVPPAGGITQAGSNTQSVTITGDDAVKLSSLAQNIPNPFDNHTVINYNVPAGNKGYVRISNERGEVIKTIPLAEGGGKLELNFSDFPAGQLIYSMYVNDKLVDTKKMMKVK
jgi:hypothetical protein